MPEHAHEPGDEEGELLSISDAEAEELRHCDVSVLLTPSFRYRKLFGSEVSL